MKTAILSLLAALSIAWAQQPVINPNGVVSAASYTVGIQDISLYNPSPGDGGPALAAESLATIFGSNLASTIVSGQLPFPRELGGTSVSVYGVAAPLLFVSPNQINFQVPSGNDTTPGASSAAGIVVTTAAGQSTPFQLGGSPGVPGIFTVNGTGCGQGAVLNVAADSSVSLNSPTHSAVPGRFISIYGTGNGFVYNDPPDGMPAPFNPLAMSAGGDGGILFDFSSDAYGGTKWWIGRAPGLVGVDQFNILVPPTVRQGCAVPLQVWNDNISPPVTISIASDGGPCSDPPSQGYGDILWEKTTVNNPAPDFTVTTSETVTVALQSSPGRQPPETITAYTPGWTLPGMLKLFGPACAIPGYKSLNAGSVTAQGPGLTATALSSVPLPSGTVQNNDGTLASQSEFSQAAGMTVYQASLPTGTIKPGAFTVSANGGSDVGAFQSTVQIGSPIQVITALAGRALFTDDPPLQIQWTGGDANSWVVVRLVGHGGASDTITQGWVARASDGQIMIQGAGGFVGFTVLGPIEMIIDVVPDPSQISSITAPNLSLGGRAQWKYSYHFEGMIAQQGSSTVPLVAR